MPNILLIRMLKNIVIFIVMLSAGIIFGISTHSMHVAIIPLLFGLIAAGATIKMYFDWKRDKVVTVTAVCLQKQQKLLGKSTYVFNITGCTSDKGYTFTLNNLQNNCFILGETYDFLFSLKGNTISEQNLIDYAISYIPTPQEITDEED